MTEISIYRIILGLISIFFLANGIVRFIKKEKGQSFLKILLIFIVWGAIFLFSFFPNMSHIISKELGLGENLNTLIFSGFVFSFLIIFQLMKKIDKLDSNLSAIVRKEALKDLEK